METHLRDKVAIVTGGGSGIGRATALALGQEGARVAVVDIQPGGSATPGSPNLALSADVTQPEQVRAAFAGVLDSFGQLDILANCAGIAQFEPLPNLTWQDWDRVLDVNLKGTVVCCQTALPYMQAQGSGHIVNIGSVAGRIGGQISGANYAASKAAVMSYTRSLARQFGREGIVVNCINPGPIASPMTAEWPPEWIDAVLSGMPLGRLGRPEEVAAMIVFLASGLADYLHGAQIDMNGGMYMS